MTAPGDRLAAAAALLLTLLLLLLVTRLTLLPLWQGDPGLAAVQAATNSYRAIAARQDTLRRDLAALGPVMPTPGERLAAPGDALAQAALQTRLAELAAGFGVTLAASEPLPPDAETATGRILLRLELAGHLSGIEPLIGAIDSGPPLMVIRRLELKTGGETLANALDPALTADLTVAAWRTVP